MNAQLPAPLSTLPAAPATGDEAEEPVELGGPGLAVVGPSAESSQTLQREGSLRAALLEVAE